MTYGRVVVVGAFPIRWCDTDTNGLPRNYRRQSFVCHVKFYQINWSQDDCVQYIVMMWVFNVCTDIKRYVWKRTVKVITHWNAKMILVAPLWLLLTVVFIRTTLWSARWRVKSPASRLFNQLFIQTQIKENIKAPRHWPLWGKFTGDQLIVPHNAQRSNNAENISIWWRHHVKWQPRARPTIGVIAINLFICISSFCFVFCPFFTFRH